MVKEDLKVTNFIEIFYHKRERNETVAETNVIRMIIVLFLG